MNKTLIITCATGTIGESVCKYLAGKGYNLILISKSQEKLNTLKTYLTNNYSIKVKYVVINFDYECDFNILKSVCSSFINVMGLVLITPKITPTSNCFPEKYEWEENFRRVFINPLELLKNIVPYLQLNNMRAKIVIISGISSVQALPNYVINNAIRTAWLGQAKSLALHYGGNGIHINTLSLGGIMTDIFLKNVDNESLECGKSPQEILAAKIDNVPLKKYASLSEVSVVIENLLSGFTDHITGANIICDGGFIKSY
ncbi:MAG: SDR family oxidoreductase [Burkholderiales bacterium]|nr:SDR family oxidoreductase [Burkholderiales bacterium]